MKSKNKKGKVKYGEELNFDFDSNRNVISFWNTVGLIPLADST